jgi:hypothetical protein
LAKSDSNSTCRTAGLVTHDIENNADGFVTTFGYVRQIKTNYSGAGIWGTTWATGDLLYVSKTDAGQLTNVEPDEPHCADIVGTVGVVGAAGTGSILVNIQRHKTLEDLSDVDGTALTTTGQVPVWDSVNEYFDFNYNIIDITPETARIGGETNNTSFDSAGHQTMNGTATVFKDELQSLLLQLKNNPSDNLVVNVAEGTLDYKDSATTADYAVMNVQINHDWKIGSIVYPHLHWFQSQAGVPNWLIQYRWQINGEAKTTSWTNYPLNTQVFTYTSGTIMQISHNSGLTPPEGAGLSDILQLRLIRDSNNTSTEFAGNDPVTGNVSTVNLDVHYEINSIGSDEEYVK